MASEMYDFIQFLLSSRANREAFWNAPEDTMRKNGLGDREKQVVLFSMNRPLICNFLLGRESKEAGNTKTPAQYQALAKLIVNKYAGWQWTADPGHPFMAKATTINIADVTAMAAAMAWSDPEQKSRGVVPNSDAQLNSAIVDFSISGPGIFLDPAAIILTKERLPSSETPPHEIPATVLGHGASTIYDSRTVFARVDLTGHPTGMYNVIVYNELWWSVDTDARFEVTKTW